MQRQPTRELDIVMSSTPTDGKGSASTGSAAVVSLGHSLKKGSTAGGSRRLGTTGRDQHDASTTRSGSRSVGGGNNSSKKGGSSSKSTSQQQLHDRTVIRVRMLLLSALVCIAAILSTLFYFILRSSETSVAEIQYQSIVDTALDTAYETHQRKRLGTESMVSIASNLNPIASEWPFVTVDGYEEMATKLIETSNGREMGFAPMVLPSQRVEFENFIYNYYRHTREPKPFPNTTGVSPFGEGLWQPSPQNGTKIPVDPNGDTLYPSPNKMYFPLIHHNAGVHPVLLNNLRFEPIRGHAIDNMLECSQKRKSTILQHGQRQQLNNEDQQQQLDLPPKCGLITDMIILTSQGFEPGPGALIMQPIYPRNNPTEMTGVIASSIVWDEILVNVFSSEVSGIDVILETETQVYTYEISKGKAKLVGEGRNPTTLNGQSRRQRIGQYKRKIQLTGVTGGSDVGTGDGGSGGDGSQYDISSQQQYSDFSARYILTVYPTDEFFDSYRTYNPIIASIGATMCIAVTALLFFLYDYYVTREFNSKMLLLEAKRQYVRFVSHEVRTPLNSVCMGLTLMQEEIGAALGINNDNDVGINVYHGGGGGGGCEADNDDDDDDDGTIQNSDRSTSADRNADGGNECMMAIGRSNAMSWFDLAQEIMINAQSSVDVLNDLLNYDKIESGSGLSLEYAIINIWNLIESTVGEFKLPASAKQLDYQLYLPSSSSRSSDGADIELGGTATKCATSLSQDVLDCKVVGDSVRITQVLRNLLSNAVKFTKDGGKLTVRASWKPVHQTKTTFKQTFNIKNTPEDEPLHVTLCGFLEVAVTDSGAGMTEQQLRDLFGDGVQFNVNELQSGQGSGLGLYISKGIVEQLGGSLSADSDGLGRGTTFTMRLPLFHKPDSDDKISNNERRKWDHHRERKSQNNDTMQATTNVKPTTKEDATTSCNSHDVQPSYLHILIVDDAPTNRKLLRRLLEHRGHRVDEADNGLEAVNMVEKTLQGKNGTEPTRKQYDSILLDYEMPQMNGPDACREMRARGCESFIVGVTGNVMPNDINYFKECGANGVLPKPFRLKEINQLWSEYGVYTAPR